MLGTEDHQWALRWAAIMPESSTTTVLLTGVIPLQCCLLCGHESVYWPDPPLWPPVRGETGSLTSTGLQEKVKIPLQWLVCRSEDSLAETMAANFMV